MLACSEMLCRKVQKLLEVISRESVLLNRSSPCQTRYFAELITASVHSLTVMGGTESRLVFQVRGPVMMRTLTFLHLASGWGPVVTHPGSRGIVSAAALLKVCRG